MEHLVESENYKDSPVEKFLCRDGGYTIEETCHFRQKYIPEIFECQRCDRCHTMEASSVNSHAFYFEE